MECSKIEISKDKVSKRLRIEIVDLVKRFPVSIWLQTSASIQTRTSLLKFEDRKFCRSHFRSHAERLVDVRLSYLIFQKDSLNAGKHHFLIFFREALECVVQDVAGVGCPARLLLLNLW